MVKPQSLMRFSTARSFGGEFHGMIGKKFVPATTSSDKQSQIDTALARDTSHFMDYAAARRFGRQISK